MMLCANIKVSAADVVDMEIGGGHRTVCVFDQAIEIMSNDYILILPNNDTLRMDIMLNGTVTKGLKSLRISKVDKDSVLLEEGSHIIKCSSEEQVNSVGTQLSQQTSVSQIKMDKMTGVGNAVYTVEENGQIKDSSGNVVNQNNFPVRTTSIKEEIKQFEEKVDERIKAKQEEESKPVYVPQPEPEKVVEKKAEVTDKNKDDTNKSETIEKEIEGKDEQAHDSDPSTANPVPIKEPDPQSDHIDDTPDQVDKNSDTPQTPNTNTNVTENGGTSGTASEPTGGTPSTASADIPEAGGHDLP